MQLWPQAATFMTLGCLYAAVMAVSAFSYRVPQEGWVPDGWVAPVSTLELENQSEKSAIAGSEAQPGGLQQRGCAAIVEVGARQFILCSSGRSPSH